MLEDAGYINLVSRSRVVMIIASCSTKARSNVKKGHGCTSPAPRGVRLVFWAQLCFDAADAAMSTPCRLVLSAALTHSGAGLMPSCNAGPRAVHSWKIPIARGRRRACLPARVDAGPCHFRDCRPARLSVITSRCHFACNFSMTAKRWHYTFTH